VVWRQPARTLHSTCLARLSQRVQHRGHPRHGWDLSKSHAPGIYRLAKWACNGSSDLLIRDHIVKSAQGVQRDGPLSPLSPLLFSLAIRPRLKRLTTHCGDDRLVLAWFSHAKPVGLLSCPMENLMGSVTQRSGQQSTQTSGRSCITTDTTQEDRYLLPSATRHFTFHTTR
jgi:hypothetical protein